MLRKLRGHTTGLSLRRTTIIALGLLTIVIQWDESFVQNISPKMSKIAKCIPIVLCPTKIKLGKVNKILKNIPMYISEGIMFVIGIHEHRDQDYPKQSTVER